MKFLIVLFQPKSTKILNGTCNKCKRSKSMAVIDAVFQENGLNVFFENVDKAAKIIGETAANNSVK